MATRPTEALSIIPQYNINPYDAVTNPYGFDAGGHIYNHLQSFRYVVQIENYLTDLVQGIDVDAAALAQAVQSASQSAQAAAQSAQNAAQFDPASYAPKASPVFTGNPTAPTPAAGDNDTSIATTAFVTAATVAERQYTLALIHTATLN